jgi:hypothetical protein
MTHTQGPWVVKLKDRKWVIKGPDKKHSPVALVELEGFGMGPSRAVREANARLIAAAPRLAGWRFTPRAVLTDPRRVPFRLAPRPSLDLLGAPISARHEAYA